MGRRSQSSASKYGQMSRSTKGKRKVAVRPPMSYVPAPNGESTAPTPVAAPAPRPAVVVPRYGRRGQQTAEALSTDYRYIVKDLRQIVITGVAMFAIIAVLALVVH